MFDYKDKVVAITGGGSGLGAEMASQLCDKGAKYFALADMRPEALEETKAKLEAKGAEVITAVFDVTCTEDFEAFARLVFEKFGGCDMFFNNAGTSPNQIAWESPMRDWEWVFNTNVMGVVRGINAFVPRMIAQDKECCIFNTSSLAGLACFWGASAYIGSKHAVLGITEVLELDLRKFNTKVKAYAICPGVVKSHLYKCDEYRPGWKKDWKPLGPQYQSDGYAEIIARSAGSQSFGMDTDVAIANIIKEFEQDKFILLSHAEVGPRCEARYHRYLTEGLRPVYVEPKAVSQAIKDNSK